MPVPGCKYLVLEEPAWTPGPGLGDIFPNHVEPGNGHCVEGLRGWSPPAFLFQGPNSWTEWLLGSQRPLNSPSSILVSGPPALLPPPPSWC